jgi:hypothetical protein
VLASRRRRLTLLVVATAAAVGTAVAVLVGRSPGRHAPRVEVGSAAPEFTGRAVRGGDVDLRRLRHHVVLVTFLNSRAEATFQGDPSRAQLVSLRSMQQQHARFGLRVIVLDAAELAGAGRTSHDDLVNFTYDWHLGRAIAVLPDDGILARRFGVDRVPTTFLIGPDGIVRRRWNGLALPAQLDLSIRRLEGRAPVG